MPSPTLVTAVATSSAAAGSFAAAEAMKGTAQVGCHNENQGQEVHAHDLLGGLALLHQDKGNQQGNSAAEATGIIKYAMFITSTS